MRQEHMDVLFEEIERFRNGRREPAGARRLGGLGGMRNEAQSRTDSGKKDGRREEGREGQ